MKCMLDTNAAIYMLRDRLVHPLPEGAWFVSVISELELLSWPQLRTEDEAAIRKFLGRVTILGLDQNIKKATVQLRRTTRLKLPDAIIAATAISIDADLYSNDVQILAVPGVRGRQLLLNKG